MNSTAKSVKDERNESVKIYVNGAIVPRAEARISVFDSGFMLGDGIWESFRLIRGRLAFLDSHLGRLFDSLRAIDLDLGHSPEQVSKTLYGLLDANEMYDGVHIRLMVTRGEKSTPTQDPRLTMGPPTLVIIPEYKLVGPSLLAQGVRLATVSTRCSDPSTFDMRLNSHSRLNLITALLQAIAVGADEALMLDPAGFVSSCNATNFFIVRSGELWTSTGRFCFNGLTRRHVLDIAASLGISVFEKDFTLAETYSADEAFVTGTFPGVVPVTEVDNRPIGGRQLGGMTKQLLGAYRQLLDNEGGPHHEVGEQK